MDLAILLDRVNKPIDPELEGLYTAWEFKKMFSGGIVGAIKMIFSSQLVDTRVSPNYTRNEIAEILVENKVCESKEAALKEMPNILARKYHDYSWQKLINSNKESTIYYLQEEYTDSD